LSADPAGGAARIRLDRVDSTSAEAFRRAPAAPTWIVAAEQTLGRGRRGRGWVSPPGNFHGTLVLRPEDPPAAAALKSFVAAVALHEALAGLTGLPDAFALKWPNDVLLNGGKVAGILLESRGQGGRVELLAIGIGVNLAVAPDPAAVEPGAVRPVALLAETGCRVTPGELLDALAPAFARWDAALAAGGFEPVRRDWLARAARLGEPVTARTGRVTRQGIFEGLDATGALVLSSAAGRETIPAAEVFFG
jgi:BirA family biotin operon repressor/biotin-[acetyl-CoA-carboxylase] ligase